ncbi:TPA: respiratory chain complex I subunit 1 family protein [Methanopyrus kandleri]|uniref:Membrane protein related to formate hydrogenlyase subunit 4 n=2 Tax=Methanopyrus kandleri TaxID=2320 RepID=Q8TY38_METKA|nr:Membrane protein related to formate hydrogenlyase subunit 4 [Methanopyrus kandleri AV19]HII70372.1 respiratory chain complex I subunit 1 family protein [Methanopyrus kandleri]
MIVLETLVGITEAFLVGSVFLGLHRKVMARIQRRPGPPIVQEFLHTLKFMLKEGYAPLTSAEFLYWMVPVFNVIIWSAAVTISAVYRGNLLPFFALYASYKVLSHGAGVSSGSTYTKIGGVRHAIMPAGELALACSLISAYFVTGHMDVTGILAWEHAHGPLIEHIPFSALAFFTLLWVDSPYSPLDPSKGYDIVEGYLTEYPGFLRGLMYVAEAIKYYCELWVFQAVFLGISDPVSHLLTMGVLTLLLASMCALTPILNPYQAVGFHVIIASMMFLDFLVLG